MVIDEKRKRNRFITRFLVVGTLVYPALMIVAASLDWLLKTVGRTPDLFSWSHSLYGIVCLLLSPGALLMMDAEHRREILWALPFVTLVNALWYAVVGAIVWHVRESAMGRDSD